MRKLFTLSLATALVAMMAASPLLAKTHEFSLGQDSRLKGTELKAGTYKLELNGDTDAVIYNTQNKTLATRAEVRIKPLQSGQNRNSVVRDAEGNITEIRLSKEVVVFVR